MKFHTFYDRIISFIEALKSIHDSYSRFVTVHGTHEAIVKDVVGYNCHGHGFFLEDGYETENKLIGNLGIMVLIDFAFRKNEFDLFADQ